MSALSIIIAQKTHYGLETVTPAVEYLTSLEHTAVEVERAITLCAEKDAETGGTTCLDGLIQHLKTIDAKPKSAESHVKPVPKPRPPLNRKERRDQMFQRGRFKTMRNA